MDDVIISGITGLPKSYLSKVIFEIIKMKDKDKLILEPIVIKLRNLLCKN